MVTAPNSFDNNLYDASSYTWTGIWVPQGKSKRWLSETFNFVKEREGAILLGSKLERDWNSEKTFWFLLCRRLFPIIIKEAAAGNAKSMRFKSPAVHWNTTTEIGTKSIFDSTSSSIFCVYHLLLLLQQPLERSTLGAKERFKALLQRRGVFSLASLRTRLPSSLPEQQPKHSLLLSRLQCMFCIWNDSSSLLHTITSLHKHHLLLLLDALLFKSARATSWRRTMSLNRYLRQRRNKIR